MCGTKESRNGLGSSFPVFFTGNKMMSTRPCDDELTALRRLEQAVRACGLPTMMVSGQAQLDMLAAALKAVVDARSGAACAATGAAAV